jgi:pilus assembly protein CpaC
MSALVALAGIVPWAATASPVADKVTPVTAKAYPVAAKAAPVTVKTTPVAAKPSPMPLVSKASPMPVAAKLSRPTSGAKHVAAKASRSNSGGEPVAALDSPSNYFVPVGESRVYRLAQPVSRVAIGDPEVADYIMINPSELYLLGKKAGTTNLVVWDRTGSFTSSPLHVSRNSNSIKELLKVVLPNEKDIQLYTSGAALIIAGSVSDALAAETALRIVKAHSGGTVPEVNPETTLANNVPTSGYTSQANISGVVKSSAFAIPLSGNSAPSGIPGVVNLLKIRDPQQVRLEVRIAEVSRSWMESLGLGLMKDIGGTQGSLMTGFVSNSTLNLILNATYDPIRKITLGKTLQVDAERKNELIKILAEPTIVTMSGQEGYFLVGGKIYTPTVTTNGAVDYVERTYGVGLRCTPTVLDAGRMSLRVAPEVSEPLKEAVNAGTSYSLPSFKLSYASTTVQMNEGENLVIGGLLRDNLNEVIRAVPLLGDVPLLGSLFRHTERSSEKTELLIIIRPTLVKASVSAPDLPTDKFIPPTNSELFIGGKLQGSRRVK